MSVYIIYIYIFMIMYVYVPNIMRTYIYICIYILFYTGTCNVSWFHSCCHGFIVGTHMNRPMTEGLGYCSPKNHFESTNPLAKSNHHGA